MICFPVLMAAWIKARPPWGGGGAARVSLDESLVAVTRRRGKFLVAVANQLLRRIHSGAEVGPVLV